MKNEASHFSTPVLNRDKIARLMKLFIYETLPQICRFDTEFL